MQKKVKEYKNQYTFKVPKEIIKLCEIVKDTGGTAYLVGGVVRDTVVKKEGIVKKFAPKDFDLEVYGVTAKKLLKILETNIEKVRTEGEAFAVYKVEMPGIESLVDVSLPRKESKVGEGHKGFEIQGDPNLSLTEAARRRDLTMNALLYNPLEKVLYDPFGGVEDIKNNLLQIVDSETFVDDPLRPLRVMQFAARFEFDASRETLQLCQQMAEKNVFKQLPPERITEEFTKLLIKGNKPSLGLEFVRKTKILKIIFPELENLIDMPQEPTWHPEGDVWTHTLQAVNAAVLISQREKLTNKERLTLTLAALCHDTGKAATTEKNEEGQWISHGHIEKSVELARSFLERFTFSYDVQKSVLKLVEKHHAPKDYWRQEVLEKTKMDKAMRRLSLRLGRAGTNIKMLIWLAEADQRARSPSGFDPLPREKVEGLEEWQSWLLEKAKKLGVEKKPPERLLQGKDLLKKFPKQEPGIWVGVVLDAVYNDQLDGEVENMKQAVKNGKEYAQQMQKLVNKLVQNTNREQVEIWREIRDYKDPRDYLKQHH